MAMRDVVLLHELLDARQRGGRGIPGHDHLDAGALAVFELRADVFVFIFGEVDGAGGVQLDAVGAVIGERLRLGRRSIGR